VDARYAEKLVVPVPDVLALGAALYLPPELAQEAVALV
jgi:hypothetical protein